MKKLFFTISIFCLLNIVYGQTSSIVVNEEAKIKSLMNQYLRINRNVTHVSGWRVTVITTTDRRVMEQTKADFQKNFNYNTKWEYKEPYYHLKAGSFFNRADALGALEAIKKKFSTAFISIDKIAYDELF